MKIDVLMIKPAIPQKTNRPQSAENRDFAETLESEVSGERDRAERASESNSRENQTVSEDNEPSYIPVYQEIAILPDLVQYGEESLADVLANALDEDTSLIKEVLIGEDLTYESLKNEPEVVSTLVKAIYQKETKEDLLQIEGIEKTFENINEILKNPEFEHLPLYTEETVLEEPVYISEEVEIETVAPKEVEIEIDNNSKDHILVKPEILELDNTVKIQTTQDSEISQTDIIDQIQNQIKTIVKSNSVTEMTMVLAPEQLGELTLKLTTRDGLVSASFLVESEKIKEIIEKNLKELAESLELQGVEISDLEVFVKQENNGQMEAFLREQQKSQARVSQIVNAILDEEIQNPENVIKEDNSLVDTLA